MGKSNKKETKSKKKRVYIVDFGMMGAVGTEFAENKVQALKQAKRKLDIRLRKIR